MRRLFAIVLTVALGLCTVAFAVDKSADAFKSVEQEFKSTYPNFAIESFKESPIEGLYEVVANGNIVYFSPKGYLIFGEILGKDGKSITAERKTEMMAKKVNALPLDKAFKIGNGKNQVVEITDPDCPYCRKASEFLAKRTDITRYVFFFPLKQLHPHAENHATYILAKNNIDAYQKVYSGAFDGKDAELIVGAEKVAEARLKGHEDIVQKLGVRGTPAFFINGQFVNGANIPQIEKLLGGK